jgi:hypothetical protein
MPRGTPWASCITITNGSGNTLLKTCRATSQTGAHIAGAGGAVLAYRLVIEGYSISGNNTNAAAAPILIRNATGPGPNMLVFRIPATTGEINRELSGLWLAGELGENIEANVATHTGTLTITLWGRMIASTDVAADRYDFTASTGD